MLELPDSDGQTNKLDTVVINKQRENTKGWDRSLRNAKGDGNISPCDNLSTWGSDPQTGWVDPAESRNTSEPQALIPLVDDPSLNDKDHLGGELHIYICIY